MKDKINMMLENMSPYTLVSYTLRFAGLLNTEGRPWSVIYSMYQTIMITLFTICASLQFVFGNDSLKEMVLALSTIAIMIQVYCKLLTVIMNEKEIRKILERLSNYRLELLDDKENRSQVIRADFFCKKLMVYFNLLYFIFPLSSFISNLVTDYLSNFDHPHLVMQVWLPWKMYNIWQYFAGTISVLIMIWSSTLVATSYANVQFTFTFQMSVYLKILQNRLENKEPEDKLVFYHHKTVIQLIQDYNKLFSLPMYVEILVGSLEPCGYGYTIIKSIKRGEQLEFHIYYALLLTLLISLVLCSCGQEISTQMEKLHISSYSNKWYEYKPKIRRDLLTMMEVTVRPMSMNYRYFVKFDYVCFSTVMQGLYSYLTVVSSFETSD